MIEVGADIADVGGESPRPGANQFPPPRKSDASSQLSSASRRSTHRLGRHPNPEVAEAALKDGADMIKFLLVSLVASARTDDGCGVLMDVRHTEKSHFGVQFHSECILTKGGKRLVKNFCDGIATDAGTRTD